MKCCFCGQPGAEPLLHGVCLCPACLAQLVAVSPFEPRYRWFIAALRRAAMDA